MRQGDQQQAPLDTEMRRPLVARTPFWLTHFLGILELNSPPRCESQTPLHHEQAMMDWVVRRVVICGLGIFRSILNRMQMGAQAQLVLVQALSLFQAAVVIAEDLLDSLHQPLKAISKSKSQPRAVLRN